MNLRCQFNNWLRVVLLTLLASIVAFLAGCRMVENTARRPINSKPGSTSASKSGLSDPAALQAELQRYSDEYLLRTTEALDEYARVSDTAEAKDRALTWKVTISSTIVSIVSGPNPAANLVDLLALTTITRTSLEEYWVRTPQGESFQPWLKASRALETNSWRLAEGVLTPAQQQELRDGITQWWQSNSGERSAIIARPQDIAADVRQTGQKAAAPGSLFGMLGLDPTAGLDPAVREVASARLFAERAMYTARYMPFVLRWHLELLSRHLLHDPQVSLVLSNAASLSQSADRFSRASDALSQTAAQLPDRLSAERAAILGALETQEGRLRELSAEVSRTLIAGEKMSTSLNTTLVTFGALMKRFGVGEPRSAPGTTNTTRFDILDYARTADQLTLMAKELDVLLKDTGATLDSPALQRRMQELALVTERAKTDAKSILNHAFLLGTALVLLAFALGLVYRRVGLPAMTVPSGKAGSPPTGEMPKTTGS